MKKLGRCGEEVEGYAIPVLNEREIRAGAGMLFLMMFVSIMVVVLKGDFLLLKYAITIFLTDILLRVLVSPTYSPTLIVGRVIVRNQAPEYVGAEQKRFAWIIGAVLATIMFFHVVVVNARGPIAAVLCLMCLVFLFFETAFGICLGCKVYSMVYKKNVQYCPGEVCDGRSKHDIQKTSGAQLLVVLAFVLYIIIAAFAFHENFSRRPFELFVTKEFLTNGANVQYLILTA